MPGKPAGSAADRIASLLATRRDIGLERVGDLKLRTASAGHRPFDPSGSGLGTLIGSALEHAAKFEAATAAPPAVAPAEEGLKFVLPAPPKHDADLPPPLTEEQCAFLETVYHVSSDSFRERLLASLPEVSKARETLRACDRELSEAKGRAAQATANAMELRRVLEEHEKLGELLEVRRDEVARAHARSRNKFMLQAVAGCAALGCSLPLAALGHADTGLAAIVAVLGVGSLVTAFTGASDTESPALVDEEVRELREAIEQKVQPAGQERMGQSAAVAKDVMAAEAKVKAARAAYAGLLERLADGQHLPAPRMELGGWAALKGKLEASLGQDSAAEAGGGRRILLGLMERSVVSTLLLQRAAIPRFEVNVDAFIAEVPRYSSNLRSLAMASDHMRKLLQYWRDRKISERLTESLSELAALGDEALRDSGALRQTETADSWAQALADRARAALSSLPAAADAVAEHAGYKRGM